MVDLHMTNVLLGIMAAVSVLEALVLIGAGVGGFLAYRRVMQLAMLPPQSFQNAAIGAT